MSRHVVLLSALLMAADALLVAGCGPSTSPAALAEEHFPHAGGRPNGRAGNVRIYTSARMTPLESTWAVESVRGHVLAYRSGASGYLVPVDVYVYSPDVGRLTGLQRTGELAYSLPGTTAMFQSHAVATPPQIHTIAGFKVSTPLVLRELHQVNTGFADPWRQDPALQWAQVEQLSLLVAFRIQQSR